MLAIDGKVEVRCGIERAWDLFCRFGEVAALIPTVEQVQVDGDRVHARVATRLGALPVSSRVTLEVVERKPLACLKAEGLSYLGETVASQIAVNRSVRGVDSGSVGRLRLHLDLRPGERDGHTAILYFAEVEAEGRLRRIYESILKTKAPAMMAQFAENLRRALEGPEAAPAAERALPGPEAVPAAERALPGPEAVPAAERALPGPEAVPAAERALPGPEAVPAAERAPPARAASRGPGGRVVSMWRRFVAWLRRLW